MLCDLGVVSQCGNTRKEGWCVIQDIKTDLKKTKKRSKCEKEGKCKGKGEGERKGQNIPRIISLKSNNHIPTSRQQHHIPPRRILTINPLILTI